MKIFQLINKARASLKHLTLATAVGAVFMAGHTSAQTTIANGATVTVTDPNTYFGGAGDLTMDNGATLSITPTSQGNYTIANAFIFGGSGGTINLNFKANDTVYTWTGAITSASTGPQTLAIATGIGGNGDREEVTFDTGIPDVADASALGLHVTFNTQTGSQSYVNLVGLNTFTGPITLVKGSNVTSGYLTIGGRLSNGANAVGLGSLNSGSYAGNIALDAATILNYDSSAPQTLSGAISGAGALQVSGSGTLTLDGLNTYSGNTIVKSGTLALGAAGSLTCVVSNAATSKITGTGVANLEGTLNIDTSAVTLVSGSWTLVDVATPSYGSSFSVGGFTGAAGVWTKVDAGKTWSFDTANGKLSVSGPALLTSFTILGYPGVIDNAAKTVQVSVPSGSDLTSLVPTYHASTGSGSPASDTPNNFTSPATYTITDGSTVNTYTVNVSVFAGLNVKTYKGQAGQALLAPISNLMALTPSASGVQVNNIEYHGGTFAVPGNPSGDNFAILWEGWFDVLAAGGHGDYTFGTSSDDGSVIYMDLNGNGSFADAGEFIVNNNFNQGDTARTGTVTLNTDSVHIVIGYYEGGGGYDMRAGWKLGTGYAFTDLTLVNGTSGVFFATDPHPPVAQIASFGIPKHAGVIDSGLETIALRVPYGTDLSTLAPTFTLTTGSCSPGNGMAPSPSFAIQNPATYTVTDSVASVTHTYTVTVTVGAPPAGPPPVTDYARHFDASLIDLADGEPVTQWNDGSVHAANATVPSGNATPALVGDSGSGTSLGAVYFAGNSNAGNSAALNFTEDTAIRTVFSVFKGSSFLLTDSTQYHFHRPTDNDATSPIWDSGNASGNIRGGSTFVNGVAVNGTTFVMPTSLHNGFNLIEVLTSGSVTADSFNKDRGADHAGNQYQAEVLIYDRVLTENERVETEHYLMSKWFGTDYSAQITSIGIPGSSYSIDPVAMTIALTVPYGTNLATLAPTVTLSSGTCSPASGSAPSPDFSVQNPAIYTVNDAAKGITNTYTVTVNITPAATGAAMLRVAAAGGGYAWPTDVTGLNLELVVPNSASLSAVAATFSLSPFATCVPASGTVRDFTTAQTYTVTAQDGTTQTYSLALRKIASAGTGYQALVLASAPVSYWPLNEAVGATTAVDMASGLNNITYGGTYTLGDVGLRSDGNPSVLFTNATTTAGGNTGVAYNNSLNPSQFTVEFWYKHLNSTTAQYLVSLQDRSNGANRLGYAFQQHNAATQFQFTYGKPGNQNGTLTSGTDLVIGSVYHVVATYDGTTMKMYVNGAVKTSADDIYVPATATQPGFTIGSRNGNTAMPSNIQDVAIYSRALTASEILSHYNNAPATLTYADWATAHGISGQAGTADADHDGMSNFQEYAFGLNPESGKSVSPISVPFNKASGTFSYTRTVNTGLTYTVWHSADLVTWTSTGSTQGTAVADGGDVETVPVTLDASLLAAPKLFVRVQAQ